MSRVCMRTHQPFATVPDEPNEAGFREGRVGCTVEPTRPALRMALRGVNFGLGGQSRLVERPTGYLIHLPSSETRVSMPASPRSQVWRGGGGSKSGYSPRCTGHQQDVNLATANARQYTKCGCCGLPSVAKATVCAFQTPAKLTLSGPNARTTSAHLVALLSHMTSVHAIQVCEPNM